MLPGITTNSYNPDIQNIIADHSINQSVNARDDAHAQANVCIVRRLRIHHSRQIGKHYGMRTTTVKWNVPLAAFPPGLPEIGLGQRVFFAVFPVGFSDLLRFLPVVTTSSPA